MEKSQPFFSIVIPALNEERFLPLLLADLSKQTFKDFEVVVIDGNSSDKTVPETQKFEKKIKLHIFSTKKSNVSHQRNLGATRSVAPWIIFMDADNRIEKDFLKKLIYSLHDSASVDFFTCLMHLDYLKTREEKIIALTYNIGIQFYKLIGKPTAVGALIGVKKNITQKQKFKDASSLFEDDEFIKRLFQQDYKFEVFSKPRFIYSFRRFESYGTLKILSLYAEANLLSILGKDISRIIKKYPMEGGSSYQEYLQNLNEVTSGLKFIKTFRTNLKEAPKKIYNKIKELAEILNQIE